MDNKSISKGDKEFDDWMRDFYNKKSKNISEKGYEYARWFSSPKKIRQHKFTTKSLLFHLEKTEIKKCLEIGCGPGTWTNLLLKKYPNANFTCVDISKEMLEQLKKVNSKKVKTIESSFLDYNSNEKFNFIFSSRSIEYIPNKDKIIRKFSEFLEPKGKGIIVTSPPHPLVLSIKNLFVKKKDKEHTKRISITKMRELLLKYKFKNIKFYPILFSDFFLVPRNFLFNNFYKKEWNLISKMFASGYIVKFEKP